MNHFSNQPQFAAPNTKPITTMTHRSTASVTPGKHALAQKQKTINHQNRQRQEQERKVRIEDTSGGGSTNYNDVMHANLPMSNESNDDTKANILNSLILKHAKRTIHLGMHHGKPGIKGLNPTMHAPSPHNSSPMNRFRMLFSLLTIDIHHVSSWKSGYLHSTTPSQAHLDSLPIDAPL
ncbi:hypothetical protein L3Y34_013727 [Caenorhabditis briggsae]|uniref:Uncharacterized protein n=1 Tax=Caenorhabditis briggsae TaxID=6238 RepID=A0AAE9CXX3_CAEBR|nr:hypothetical protein L3Y34_013727 [Caenorhabditis briggsae]